MTTRRQVQKLVQPLLDRRPDLALVGRLIVMTPVHHILRGVYIDATSSSDVSMPRWFVNMLFRPGAGVMFNWGAPIYAPYKGLWRISDPRTSTFLADTIESVALPIIQPVQTIDDLIAFATKERFPLSSLRAYKYWSVFVDLALGDLESARATCSVFEGRLAKKDDRLHDWQIEEYSFLIDVIVPLIEAQNRPAIAQLLHGFEAQAVEREKLGAVWRRTPFPIEAT